MASWGRLEAVFGFLEVPKKLVEPMKYQHFCVWSPLGPIRSPSGGLGASWRRLGGVLEDLGPSWGRLGEFWVRLGGRLGVSLRGP